MTSEPPPRRLTSISDLPTEILHEIVGWAVDVPGMPSLRSVCLVSTRFKDITQPLLHATIALGGYATELRERRRINQLKTLGNESWYLASYTRTIAIDYTPVFSDTVYDDQKPERASFAVEVALNDHLEDVLLSFRNLEKVIWNISNREPVWLHKLIADSLIRLPKLEDLSFVNHHGFIDSVTFSKFKGLRKISIDKRNYGDSEILFLRDVANFLSRSPSLSELQLHNFDGPELVFLFQRLSIQVEHIVITSRNLSIDDFNVFSRHFNKLQSISVVCCDNPNHFCRISTSAGGPRKKGLWEILLRDEVRLKKIVSGGCDLGLVPYLTSYHGLEYLDINLRTTSQIPKPAKLYSKLSNALRQYHGENLIEFHVRTVYSDVYAAWCFAVGAMSSMPNLRRFGIVCGGETNPSTFGTTPTIGFLLACCEVFLKNLEELILYLPSSGRSQSSTTPAHDDAIHRSILAYDIKMGNCSTFHVLYDKIAYFRELDVETGRLVFVKRSLI